MMLGTPASPVWFTPWRERAICRDDRDWFPSDNDHRAIAALKAICQECPVQSECLDDALRYPKTSDFGILGGLTPAERNEIRKKRKHERESAGTPPNGPTPTPPHSPAPGFFSDLGSFQQDGVRGGGRASPAGSNRDSATSLSFPEPFSPRVLEAEHRPGRLTERKSDQ